MPEELLVTEAFSQTTGVRGRSLNRARTNHFVVDEPGYAGGPGEAVTPAEIFLAGVSACSVLLVESFAREDGVPLKAASARIEGIRTRANPADFKQVNLRIELAGPSREQADRLVERFKGR